MTTSHPFARATIGAVILTGVLTLLPTPVNAEPQTSCQAAQPSERSAKKKGPGLGGLLSAAKRAGVGNVLGTGMLGDGKAAQVASVVAGTAVEASGSSVASAASELAKPSRSGCATAPAGAEPTPQREWHAKS